MGKRGGILLRIFKIYLGIVAVGLLCLFFGCLLGDGGDRPATPEELREYACDRRGVPIYLCRRAPPVPPILAGPASRS